MMHGQKNIRLECVCWETHFKWTS